MRKKAMLTPTHLLGKILALSFALGLIFFFACSPIVLAKADEEFPIGLFSQAQPGGSFPDGWKPLTFEKIPTHTQYELVKDGEQTVVKATSRQSSSGLTREIMIDPKEYPIIQWRWKVSNTFNNGDMTKKSGDDYPARIYITFQYDRDKVGFFEEAKYEAAKLLYGEYPPIGAINYIWESKSPIGTIAPNPYTDRVQMFVIESGETRLDEWVMEERNIYEDYKRAFGEDPPKISGVAIMTDTDNTQEEAVSFFGDIVFKKSLMSHK